MTGSSRPFPSPDLAGFRRAAGAAQKPPGPSGRPIPTAAAPVLPMNSPFYSLDDDPFAVTRMSFGGHLDELRLRLIRALLGVPAGFALGLLIGREVIGWLTAP